MSDDWRIPISSHLKGVKLQRRRWQPWSEQWYFDHCTPCNALFADSALVPDALQDGYTTCSDYVHGPGYDWVCPQCFAELKDELDWTEVPAEPGSIVRRDSSDDEVAVLPHGKIIRK